MTIEELQRHHPVPERVLQVAAEAAAIVRTHLGGKVRILWYGSWVRGRAAARSDIDLAVLANRPVATRKMGVLREVLEERPTLFQVDVVDLNETERTFRDEVLRTGIDL